MKEPRVKVSVTTAVTAQIAAPALRNVAFGCYCCALEQRALPSEALT